MRKPLLLLTLVSAAVLTSCGKPQDEDDTTRFSVLGDSYSAFLGYVTPETNSAWYGPTPLDTIIDVTNVEDMWWYKVAVAKEWVLDHNNSFTGGTICNLEDYDVRSYFLWRMDNLGDPNVIFVFGGTNDVWYEAPLGDYVYENWTEEQLQSFRPALAYLFVGLSRLYPKAKVHFMLDMNLGEGYGVDWAMRQEYIESIRQITAHLSVSASSCTTSIRYGTIPRCRAWTPSPTKCLQLWTKDSIPEAVTDGQLVV